MTHRPLPHWEGCVLRWVNGEREADREEGWEQREREREREKENARGGRECQLHLKERAGERGSATGGRHCHQQMSEREREERERRWEERELGEKGMELGLQRGRCSGKSKETWQSK